MNAPEQGRGCLIERQLEKEQGRGRSRTEQCRGRTGCTGQYRRQLRMHFNVMSAQRIQVHVSSEV